MRCAGSRFSGRTAIPSATHSHCLPLSNLQFAAGPDSTCWVRLFKSSRFPAARIARLCELARLRKTIRTYRDSAEKSNRRTSGCGFRDVSPLVVSAETNGNRHARVLAGHHGVVGSFLTNKVISGRKLHSAASHGRLFELRLVFAGLEDRGDSPDSPIRPAGPHHYGRQPAAREGLACFLQFCWRRGERLRPPRDATSI